MKEIQVGALSVLIPKNNEILKKIGKTLLPTKICVCTDVRMMFQLFPDNMRIIYKELLEDRLSNIIKEDFSGGNRFHSVVIPFQLMYSPSRRGQSLACFRATRHSGRILSAFVISHSFFCIFTQNHISYNVQNGITQQNVSCLLHHRFSYFKQTLRYFGHNNT